MTRITRKTAVTRRGFTLLELMLVLLIIGLLAGVAAWNIVAQGDKARVKTTVQSMRVVASALKEYQLEHGQFPADLAILVTSKRIEKVPKDAWKHEFVYFPSNSTAGRDYTLYSPGKDGQSGNDDDIDYWTEQDRE
jgi:general secretion pathway protein G